MNKPRKLRLWIPITIIIVLVALNVVSFASESTMRFIVPPFSIFLGILGLSTWWIFLAGKFRWKFWLGEIGVTILLILFGMATLKYDGSAHGGMPIAFKWKWSPEVEDGIGELPVAAGNVEIGAGDPDLADFPAFLGPKQDGIVEDPGLNPDWSANPPEELWRIPVGLGWSAFSIVGERAVTQEQRGEQELVTCYHVKTGQLIWAHEDTARFSEAMGGVGPRATPTIADGVVYALGATGILNAINLESGELLWTRDSLADGGGGNIEWGKSGSPVLTEEFVIVTGSESAQNGLIAYRRDNGEIAWQAGTGPASYSTPQLLEFGGVEQLVNVFGKNVSGFDPKTGAQLWTHDWPGSSPKVANPLRYNDGQLLVTTSYTAPSKLLNIT
ncbi:MAG: PQQ-binding-like beta-propeller repeat protein, partial [Verrucomicrobiota bacterium]